MGDQANDKPFWQQWLDSASNMTPDMGGVKGAGIGAASGYGAGWLFKLLGKTPGPIGKVFSFLAQPKILGVVGGLLGWNQAANKDSDQPKKLSDSFKNVSEVKAQEIGNNLGVSADAVKKISSEFSAAVADKKEVKSDFVRNFTEQVTASYNSHLTENESGLSADQAENIIKAVAPAMRLA